MRDVEIVKNMRNALDSELTRFIDRKKELFNGRPFPELGDYDKKVFSFISTSVNKLTIQINALNFVLNEDTQIEREIGATKYFEERYDITKNSILNNSKTGRVCECSICTFAGNYNFNN